MARESYDEYAARSDARRSEVMSSVLTWRLHDMVKYQVTLTRNDDGSKKAVGQPKGWTKLKESVYGAGENFGVLTGEVNDIIIVDIDRKPGEVSGLDWFEGVFGKLEGVDSLTTSTLNDGYHVYFKYDERLSKTIHRKDMGVDILSRGACAYEGKGYPVVNDAPIRELKEEEVSGIVALSRSYAQRGTRDFLTAGAFNDAKRKPENLANVSIDKASPIANSAPAVMSSSDDVMPLLHMIAKHRWDDRGDWVAIATALKNHAGDKYLGAWMQLSRLSPKFVEGDARKTWDSLARTDYDGARMTLGTIHLLAKHDDPLGYQEYRARRVPRVVQNNWDKGDRGLADICKAMFCDIIKNVGKAYYVFDETECVWRMQTGNNVKRVLSVKLDALLRDLENSLSLKAASLAIEDPVRAKMDADRKELSSLLKYVRSNRGMNNVMGMAGDEFMDAAFEDKLDSVPHLLGVSGGVIDLRTGEKRRCRPEDMVCVQLDVDYDGNIDTTWVNDAVKKSMAMDDIMTGYLQKMLGYAITGETSEEIFVIFTGGGRNMKGVLTQTLQKMLGKFFVEVNNGVICDGRRVCNIDAERAKLRGSRIAMFNELKPGEKLKTNEVQSLSGGDGIAACAKYCDPITIQPRHLCLLSTNHMPELDEVIRAIVERLICVHFPVTFKDLEEGEEETLFVRQRDKDLKDKLGSREGFAAFLRWLVLGAMRWYADDGGLKRDAPEKVKGFTKKYLEGQDTVGRFIAEHCEVGEGLMVKGTELWDAYMIENERVTYKDFLARMKAKNYHLSDKNVRYQGVPSKVFMSIALKTTVPSETE